MGGTTVHRAFSLPVELGSIPKYNKLNAETLARVRRTYEKLMFIILDECSLLNYQTFCMINLRLCEVFNTDEPFGGRHIIVAGDLLQLRPPQGNWIFEKPNCFKAELDLWRLFEFAELTINVRQGEVDPLGRICSRLRVAQLTHDDIHALSERLLDTKNLAMDPSTFSNCTWVFNTLRDVAMYNSRKTAELREHLGSIGQKMFTIKARDFKAGTRDPCPPELIPKKANMCGGLDTTTHLGVGSRVMLRYNIDVSKGLVNGACGEVVKFEWSLFRRVQQNEGEQPTEVYVKFDHEIPGHIDNIYPIQTVSVSFYGKRHVYITREQIPLILAWAVNTHKMQGVTRERIVVDLGNSMFAKGIAYVALSRSQPQDVTWITVHIGTGP